MITWIKGQNSSGKTLKIKHMLGAEIKYDSNLPAGWKFLFHVTEDIRSADDWFQEIDRVDGIISDEYGRQSSLDEFKEIVRKNIFEKSLKTHYGLKDTMCYTDGNYDYMYGDFD